MNRAGLCAFAIVTAAAGTAHADRREASLHAHAVGGALTLGDARSDGTGLASGIAARASYATSNAFQYDAQLTLLAARASFASASFMPAGRPPVSGPFTRSAQASRLDAGATLRLGVQWIPTLRVAAGAQLVRRGAPTVDLGAATADGEEATGVAAALDLNLVGIATVGLDYRVNRRLIVGAAAGVVQAVPGVGPTWRTFDVTLHAAYYWYPRW